MSNYEVKTYSIMPSLIKAAAEAMGEVAEIEVSQDSDGQCRASLSREAFETIDRRESRADEAERSGR